MSSLQATDTTNMASIHARRNKKGRKRKAGMFANFCFSDKANKCIDADVRHLETVDESFPADEAADTISPAQASEMRKRITQLESDLSQSRDENFMDKATITKLTSEKVELESKYDGWVDPNKYKTSLDVSGERWADEYELRSYVNWMEGQKDATDEWNDELCEEVRVLNAKVEDLAGKLDESQRENVVWRAPVRGEYWPKKYGKK